MPGDFSRKTFIPQKHYSGVLMQQGRVQLDADWNEQLAIHRHRTETEAHDVIGPCGVPEATDGFKIGWTPDGSDLTISPGRIYVDGILCESEATPVPIRAFVPNNPTRAVLQTVIVDGRPFQDGQWVEIWADDKPNKSLLQIASVDPERNILIFNDDLTEFQNSIAPKVRRVTTYLTQPDYPHPDPLSLLMGSPGDGTCAVFLDVWQRDVTALDDPHIREVALDGPDTTTRVKNVWQVHLLPVSPEVTSPVMSPPGAEVTCYAPFVEWDERTAPSTGTLNARTITADDPEDPCLLPPSSGYRRLENQLYRVEVHTGGTLEQATFKWSRDNASVETTIEMIDGNKVTVTDIGKDEMLGFAAAQWVEIADDESELKGTPHPLFQKLFQIKKVEPGTREITLVQSASAFENRPHLKLRRWDQTGLAAGTNGVEMVQGWIDLEDGVQVLFSDGHYHPGDYWLIPARTATGEIEWPPFEIPNERPIPQPPLGIHHHYCRLALLEVHAGALNLTDCRMTFAPLTELTKRIPTEKPAIKIESVVTIMDGAVLENDALVPISRLSEGIRVICNVPPAPEAFGRLLSDPSPSFLGPLPVKRPCFVTLDMPYPFGADSDFWRAVPGQIFGFQPLILNGMALIRENEIDWVPDVQTSEWLQDQLFQRLGGAESWEIEFVLAHLTLKGNFIWMGESGQQPEVYLDGEGFGRPGPNGRVDMRFPTGDGRRGGDFEMWFWLKQAPMVISVGEARLDNALLGSVRGGPFPNLPVVTLTGPLPGETTTIINTDVEGTFVFQNVPAGVYELTARSDEFDDAGDILRTITAETIITFPLFDITFEDTQGDLTGTVRNGMGRRIFGARLILQSDGFSGTRVTNEEGHFDFRNVPAGAYSLEVRFGSKFKQISGITVTNP